MRRNLTSIQLMQRQFLGDPSLREDELRAKTALTGVLDSRAEFSFYSGPPLKSLWKGSDQFCI